MHISVAISGELQKEFAIVAGACEVPDISWDAVPFCSRHDDSFPAQVIMVLKLAV